MKGKDIDLDAIVSLKTWNGEIINIRLGDIPKLLKQQKQEQIEAGVWPGEE